MKVRELPSSDFKAHLQDNLGATVFLDKDTQKIAFKDKQGTITYLMDNATSTTIEDIQADIVSLQAFEANVSPTTVTEPITVEVALTAANIIGMFGAAVELVAAPGAGFAHEFISAVIIYDFDTAAYTGGGDIHIIEGISGGVLSSTLSAANGFGNSGDSVYQIVALDTAGGIALPENAALNITNLTGAFVDPGTAAGVARVHTTYRTHTTGL